MVQFNSIVFINFWFMIIPIQCQKKEMLIKNIKKIDPETYEINWNFVYYGEVFSSIQIKRCELQITRVSDNETFNWPVNVNTKSHDVSYIYDSSDTIKCANECINEIECELFYFNGECTMSKSINSSNKVEPNIITGSIRESDSNRVLVKYLPYNEQYLFKIRLYDYLYKWYFNSGPFGTNDLIIIEANYEILTFSAYIIKWKQVGTFEYPIAKYKILLAINDSDFEEVDPQDNFNKFNQFEKTKTVSTNSYFTHTLFTNNMAARKACRDLCVKDPRCVAYFIKYNENDYGHGQGICQLYDKLDPLSSTRCINDVIQSCETINNKATEFTLSGLKISTSYKVKVQFTTKFGTHGDSDIVEFQTETAEAVISVFPNGLTEGNYMRLTCTIHGITSGMLLTPNIDWYKDGVRLKDSLRQELGISMLETNKENLLTIPKLSYLKNNGNYTCKAEIDGQIIKSDSHLIKVYFGPNLINIYKNKSTLIHRVGDRIQLICPVQGHPLTPYYPEWFFENEYLLKSKNVHFKVEKVEKITSFIRQTNLNLTLTRSHNGTYICNTTNSINGEVQQIKVDLIVQSKPSGILFTKFKQFDESSAMVEWSIGDTGDLDILCMEIALNKSNIIKQTQLEVISKCGCLSNNHLKLNYELKKGYTAKLRFNNSMGYSDYSNELIYPTFSELTLSPIGNIFAMDKIKNDDVLLQAVIILIGISVLIGLLFAIISYQTIKMIRNKTVEQRIDNTARTQQIEMNTVNTTSNHANDPNVYLEPIKSINLGNEYCESLTDRPVRENLVK